MYRSSTSLLLRPLQLRPLHESINLICNMLGNMLNDLAEAIRRWTEKKDPPAAGCLQPELMPSSPIAPAHKRARSVNVRASPPDATGNFEDEVDSGSEPPSPHPTEREEEKSGNSSLTAHSCSGSTDKRVTLRAPQPAASKGVILVSEAFTEINARLVIVLASGHHSPLLESELETQMNSLLLAAKPTLTMLKVTSQPPCHLVTLKLPFLVVCWITTARHHHSRCAAGWCQCLEPTEIFSSSVALWLGSYMSISRRIQFVQEPQQVQK